MEKNHALPNSSKSENQLSDQKAIAKHEKNTAELENKVTEVNNATANATAELAKVAHIAIPMNVSNLNSKNNSSPMIANIKDAHEALPSISSSTAGSQEEVGSKTAKEQQEKSQIKNEHQALQNNVAFFC